MCLSYIKVNESWNNSNDNGNRYCQNGWKCSISNLFNIIPKPVILNTGETQVVDLKMKISLPEGTWELLKERSSMGVRGVFILGQVIESDYQGEILVVLHNTSKEVVIEVDYKICQLIII